MTAQPDWDDLRLVLAIARARSLSGAARALSVNHATVFRRLGGIENLAVERLFPVDVRRVWPPLSPEEPFYEKFGRDRIGRGTYAELITYTDHVRPLAVMLTGGTS